ncbi:PBP1A family penicillin-binding protein [Paenibacillus sp. LHD-38]|uniref:transglycosylase domain-containing protein n=1 Tax=Paenibacillus sp. LHD-38 TaxID=3072143 RepID=UPI00280CC07A|nr:PBP1A family penicillin-binding protein [Paenibacillus sp. LHD-38]MDQ8736039.1 PBP1A family penicillin-binding protein [Paenibacillus sp. LHD-38]
MRINPALQKKRKILKTILVLFTALLVIVLLGGWTTFRILINAQDIARLDVPLPAATILYDQSGAEATRISFNKIEEIGYADIPKHMVDAVIAVEDKRYFEHDGMDMRAIGRAFVTNFTSGGTVQGGSTITQQLAKNVFLSQERTWSRKWNEVLLAKKIEENYNKQEIMGMYLNQIYFGEGAWGINRAANTYFGKEPKQLTLAEAALLAGVIKAPSALTPYKHNDKALERRNVVLQLMKDQALISDETYSKAVNEPIRLLSSKPNRIDDISYPYYVDQIIREAMTAYGLSENEVLQGGLRIYTELDTKMQQAAEQVYAKESLFPDSSADQLIQSSAVMIDPRNGGIRALVGGRGEQPFRGFNRAVQLKRQPGSTIKPIAVYTPALEMGYKPNDELVDEPINMNGYEPQNADGSFHGRVSLYESLINSYNIPAVKLLNEMGIQKGIDAAERFGIPLTDEDRTLGLALGGLHEGVAPIHMAEAFGVFANDGVRMHAHAITRIESADGSVLAEFEQSTSSEKVTEPAIARTMTAMLEGVIKEGTGEAAELEDRPLAGKSGTTQMTGTTGYSAKDNWFVGYTPQLVGAVWLGYDQTDSSHYLSTSSKAAAAVFQALFTGALKDEPILSFPKAPELFVKKKKDDSNNDNNSDEENEWKSDKERDREREKEEKKNKKEREKERDKERDEEKGNGRNKNRDKNRDDDNDND